MERVTINGTAMRMDLHDAEVINYGTIMHLAGSNVTVRNNGTIMHGGGQTRIVYRDRYITSPEAEQKCKRLEAELEDTKNKLFAANRETRRLSQRIRELETATKKSNSQLHLEDLLQAALEVNHEAAQRIKELERGVCDAYLRQQIDPWDMRPTKEQCARVLKSLEAFVDIEE